MNILAIETTSTTGSIAISIDKKLNYVSLLDLTITHSERLMPQIAEGLKKLRLNTADLDYILISNGPGSFTGIRIGLATAKGLATACNIPVIPFNTLEVIAYNAFPTKNDIAVFVDARMNEVYGAIYNNEFKEIVPAGNYKPLDFLKKIKNKPYIIGSGVQKFYHLLQEYDLEFGLLHHNIPLASTMISMFYHKQIKKDFNYDEIATLEPYYLRKSQAELVKELKQK